jgi:flavin reductase (DIM6/NTAB) family NADH-FMN oxidoreductase RutF
MKIKLSQEKAYTLLNHCPVVLVSTYYQRRANVATVAWVMPVNFMPPTVALVIGEDNYSFEAIKRTKEFVINIPTRQIIKNVLGCGQCSGRTTDKFKKFSLTPLSAKTMKPPLIKECIAHLECRVCDERLVDDYNIFVGSVTYAWVDKGVYRNRLLIEKTHAQTIHHLGKGIFSIDGILLKTKR